MIGKRLKKDMDNTDSKTSLALEGIAMVGSASASFIASTTILLGKTTLIAILPVALVATFITFDEIEFEKRTEKLIEWSQENPKELSDIYKDCGMVNNATIKSDANVKNNQDSSFFKVIKNNMSEVINPSSGKRCVTQNINKSIQNTPKK